MFFESQKYCQVEYVPTYAGRFKLAAFGFNLF